MTSSILFFFRKLVTRLSFFAVHKRCSHGRWSSPGTPRKCGAKRGACNRERRREASASALSGPCRQGLNKIRQMQSHQCTPELSLFSALSFLIPAPGETIIVVVISTCRIERTMTTTGRITASRKTQVEPWRRALSFTSERGTLSFSTSTSRNLEKPLSTTTTTTTERAQGDPQGQGLWRHRRAQGGQPEEADWLRRRCANQKMEKGGRRRLNRRKRKGCLKKGTKLTTHKQTLPPKINRPQGHALRGGLLRRRHRAR